MRQSDRRVGAISRKHHVLRSALVVRALALGGSAPGFGGCTPYEALSSRASNEFSCPREQVYVLARPDVAPHLYDVEACGRHGRYMCVEGGRHHEEVDCVHEPDPPKWDLDPPRAAALARTDPASAPDLREASVCGASYPNCNCVAARGGDWSWQRCDPSGPSGF